MQELTIGDMVLRLVVSVILGALIGYEREKHGRPAGLRTHILVSVGATLFALCSYQIAGKDYDPGRVTAQIVTGIGFLGAGTIIRQGSVVRGLTTAASIWTIAAVGVAVAVGGQMLYLAIIASVLVFATLSIVATIERNLIDKHGERIVTIAMKEGQKTLCSVLGLISSQGAHVKAVDTERSADGGSQVVRIRMRMGTETSRSALEESLASSSDVISYNWE